MSCPAAAQYRLTRPWSALPPFTIPLIETVCGLLILWLAAREFRKSRLAKRLARVQAILARYNASYPELLSD
ncbi:MAG: hypothetical protein ABI743_09230 [bacterium]